MRSACFWHHHVQCPPASHRHSTRFWHFGLAQWLREIPAGLPLRGAVMGVMVNTQALTWKPWWFIGKPLGASWFGFKCSVIASASLAKLRPDASLSM